MNDLSVCERSARSSPEAAQTAEALREIIGGRRSEFQLWVTGWMHNRVRMIAASFLVKDLLLSWQSGEEWFWDTPVDADLANNAASWQWVAGCGADSAPYFAS